MNLGKRLIPISFMMMAAIAPVSAAVAQEASPVASPAAVGAISSLSLLGEQDLSNLTMVDGTLVGGLSGIDYDPESGAWVVISDDRSANNPARFYSADIAYGADGFEMVEITTEHTLLQADGEPYPNAETGGEVPDPEGIRFDPITGGYWWTSEGDRNLGINPSLNLTDADGQLVTSFGLPEAFDMHPDEELGSRNNGVLEGLTLSADGETIWLAMESPLYQDGPDATADAGSITRLIQLDRDGNVLAQYAYPLDPIAAKPEGDGGNNGVTEILAVDESRFLMIERSGVPDANNVWKMYIRVYEISIDGATDVSSIDALAGAEYVPAAKRLLLDFDDLGLDYIDNVEGLAWGPVLPNGNASIVFVSDNNFNQTQQTQFYAFEVQ